MTDLYAQIEQRGKAMPWMTAVRLDGQVVTYGALYRRLCEYDVVVSEQELSEHAGLAATLMSLLPDSIRGCAPLVQAQWVADAITWLSRGLEDADHRLIHAV